ncbi:oxidation resistance protein 1 [Linnemannia schmuckeri]|uniref:Oxidation resistance protein 1 n=1 Tax=Linnemannia schmuckeri TaxID=64567 RepID=A0A9P5V7R5_9FUNG|nr:oxidation resistance protein 1 [Linnemannia schmuckeri]
MIPRKAKQAVLSLVTTEQPKYGPSRSTQSTVHGGDWGESAVPATGGQYQQQGVEPNSAGSGQDPWMLVTGSGSSYVSNTNTNSAGLSSASGLPSNVSTPLTVREDQLNKMPALQLLERNADTDPVLDVETAHQIRLELPRKLRNATKWNLVYSSDQHGISMTTLFHRCKGKGPMVLALKDTTDAVFGAFVTEELKPNLTYYGTGEWYFSLERNHHDHQSTARFAIILAISNAFTFALSALKQCYHTCRAITLTLTALSKLCDQSNDRKQQQQQ